MWIKKLIILLLAAIFYIPNANAKDLLISNVRLIDGTGAPIREGVSILIRDGRITKIGPKVSAKGIPQLEVGGGYVLPGLIDAHVHLIYGPGAYQRNPGPRTPEIWWEAWGQYIPHYLKAYLACGVTTVLDAANYPDVVRWLQGWLAQGNPGPRYLTLGPFITTPGGYPDYSWQPVRSVEEVEAKLDLIQSLGAVGVKVPIERGWNPIWDLPIHPSKIQKAIRQGTDRRNLPIFVHATSEKDMEVALEMGAHALMHTLLQRENEELSHAFIMKMASTDAYQVTTLSVTDAMLTKYNLQRLNDPLLNLVVLDSELAMARNIEDAQESERIDIQRVVPWLPKVFQSILAKIYLNKESLESSLEHSQQAVRRLHEAGVPIVLGSDTVYVPWALYSFHGYSTLREIELLGEAGLQPMEVIKAATRNAAEMLGLENDIGTVEVGKRADLIVLNDNPLKNLQAFRTIKWTIQNGIAHTPKEWISQ